MPGFTVTRGLGGTPSAMIAMGFGPAVLKAIGGARRCKKEIS